MKRGSAERTQEHLPTYLSYIHSFTCVTVILLPGVYYNQTIAPTGGSGGSLTPITFTAPQGAVFDHSGVFLLHVCIVISRQICLLGSSNVFFDPGVPDPNSKFFYKWRLFWFLFVRSFSVVFFSFYFEMHC